MVELIATYCAQLSNGPQRAHQFGVSLGHNLRRAHRADLEKWDIDASVVQLSCTKIWR